VRRSRLAGYRKHGPVWVNPHVPKSYRGIKVRSRLLRHEKVERKLRLKQGLSYRKAHRLALESEHKGLGRRQIAVYEGKLGSVARWKPKKS
jgi:hypothetical protein